MKVTLINSTPDALETLIFTKNTRLRMTATGIAEVKAWPEDRKMAELEYMLNTIQSSWEFVDYIFLIEDVTRAFTHQLVRHRVGTSFAQQAQRAVDMTGFDYLRTGALRDKGTDGRRNSADGMITYAGDEYDITMRDINDSYQAIIKSGIPAQDARGILPTNICTNIVFKANLRTLHEMALKRLCVKAQGEFQDVFREIRRVVMEIHPWADRMLRVQCATTGTCLFPSFPVEDCPVKIKVYNPRTGHAYGNGYPENTDQIQERWERNRAEAQPGLPAEAP